MAVFMGSCVPFTGYALSCTGSALSQVKILPNKPGTAMAHMDTPQGSKNAIHHLHGTKLLGQTLELK